MPTLGELQEAAGKKGYVVRHLDRGAHHRGVRGVHGRHEIIIYGKDGGAMHEEQRYDFSGKIGVGSTLDEAIKEAQERLDRLPSHIRKE